jgi:hypothetical protein
LAVLLTSELVCAALPPGASARDLQYTVSIGKTFAVDGVFYKMAVGSCTQDGRAHVRVIKAPTLGALRTRADRGPPVVALQISSCPNLILDRVAAVYSAKKAGEDNFQFLIEYDNPISGDWLYNVTVQVVP